MIEILKDIADIFARLPDAAIWIAGGILFYKLAIVGSVFGVIRLLINRLFGYLSDKHNKPDKVSLEGILLYSSSHSLLVSLLKEYRKRRSEIDGHDFQFILDSDISFIRTAIFDRLDKYKEEKTRKL